MLSDSPSEARAGPPSPLLQPTSASSTGRVRLLAMVVLGFGLTWILGYWIVQAEIVVLACQVTEAVPGSVGYQSGATAGAVHSAIVQRRVSGGLPTGDGSHHYVRLWDRPVPAVLPHCPLLLFYPRSSPGAASRLFPGGYRRPTRWSTSGCGRPRPSAAFPGGPGWCR